MKFASFLVGVSAGIAAMMLFNVLTPHTVPPPVAVPIDPIASCEEKEPRPQAAKEEAPLAAVTTKEEDRGVPPPQQPIVVLPPDVPVIHDHRTGMEKGEVVAVVAPKVLQSHRLIKSSVKGAELQNAINTELDLIPRRVYLTWKTKKLPPKAMEVHLDWLKKDPLYERIVVDDVECEELATRFPGMIEVYLSFPINVMRADVCRYLILYYYGGIYMDTDVGFMRPLDSFLDRTQDFIAGNEGVDRGSGIRWVCQWFFAAKPFSKCLWHALNLVVERGQRIDEDNRAMVFYHTGPILFTDAVRFRCEYSPVYNRQQMLHKYIHHKLASLHWGPGQSWVAAREAYFGQKTSWCRLKGATAKCKEDSDKVDKLLWKFYVHMQTSQVLQHPTITAVQATCSASLPEGAPPPLLFHDAAAVGAGTLARWFDMRSPTGEMTVTLELSKAVNPRCIRLHRPFSRFAPMRQHFSVRTDVHLPNNDFTVIDDVIGGKDKDTNVLFSSEAAIRFRVSGGRFFKTIKITAKNFLSFASIGFYADNDCKGDTAQYVRCGDSPSTPPLIGKHITDAYPKLQAQQHQRNRRCADELLLGRSSAVVCLLEGARGGGKQHVDVLGFVPDFAQPLENPRLEFHRRVAGSASVAGAESPSPTWAVLGGGLDVDYIRRVFDAAAANSNIEQVIVPLEVPLHQANMTHTQRALALLLGGGGTTTSSAFHEKFTLHAAVPSAHELVDVWAIGGRRRAENAVRIPRRSFLTYLRRLD